MSSREATAADRNARLMARRFAELASMHAAIGVVARRSRAGQMAPERAIALVVALLDGHAVAQVSPAIERGKSRIAIVAHEGAPPDVRVLLEQAQMPAVDAAERSMLRARTEVGA